jgi:disulfide oxidoreductase YuzD
VVAFELLSHCRFLNRLESNNTISRPIIDRYIIISNVSNSNEISRPDTAIAENEMTVPVIQIADWIIGEKEINTQTDFKLNC